MNEKETNLAEIQTGQEITPASGDSQAAMLLQTLQRAVDEGKDVETLERLLAMSERIRDRQAEQDFWRDFHQARAEMPSINARGNNDGKKYALLEDIQNQIVPVYTKYGFNMLFSTDLSPIESHRRIVATLAHRAGHSEKYHTDMPEDRATPTGKVNKTPIQAAGSTDSYGQRYLTSLVWNLRILKNPSDDDGKSSEPEVVIDENETANLIALGDEVKCDWDIFLEFFGVAKVENLPKRMLAKATKMLEEKRKAG